MHIQACTHICFQEAEDRFLPEEETQGAHVAQVYSEHTADLLQSTSPLWLIPARRLQEAISVREPQVGIGARGGAGGGGGVRLSHLCAMLSQGKDGRGRRTYTPSLNTEDTMEHGLQKPQPGCQGTSHGESRAQHSLRMVVLWLEQKSIFCLVAS